MKWEPRVTSSDSGVYKYQKYSPNNPISNTLLNLFIDLLFDPGLPCFINTHSNLSNFLGTFSSLPFKSQIPFCTPSPLDPAHSAPTVLSLLRFFHGPLPFYLEFLSISCWTGKGLRESCHTMSERIASGSYLLPSSATQATRLLKSLLNCRIHLLEKNGLSLL